MQDEIDQIIQEARSGIKHPTKSIKLYEWIEKSIPDDFTYPIEFGIEATSLYLDDYELKDKLNLEHDHKIDNKLRLRYARQIIRECAIDDSAALTTNGYTLYDSKGALSALAVAIIEMQGHGWEISSWVGIYPSYDEAQKYLAPLGFLNASEEQNIPFSMIAEVWIWDKKELRTNIKNALQEAAKKEAQIQPFSLSGRGHEPRITLDRELATMLRGTDLPRVHISGYGANYHYPKRVFVRASKKLRKSYETSVIAAHGSQFYLTCHYN